MNILIDECLPKYLKSVLTNHHVRTVQDAGWSDCKNGDLLHRAEQSFDVFLTADQNLRYQQNLTNRNLAIIVFPTNRLPVVKQYEQMLQSALESISHGDFIQLTDPAAS
jgi:predicted nuclease of predicted toxin-antitoxin system